MAQRRWSLLAAVLGAAVLASAAPALAQLQPARTYYGKDRPIPMTVTVPEGQQGDVEVQLLAPVTAEVVHSASAAEGNVNLATMFPNLWTSTSPSLVYAQLVVGGEKVGPAVVLQPMVTPPYATAVDQAGNPRFPPEATRQKVYSGIRAYVDQHIVLETDKGEIELAMRPDMAPNTVWNFRQLVEGGFYTDIIFHRIVASNPQGNGFVVQVGDPTGSGAGGPGYFIDLEPSTLPHDFGVVSMARTGDPNTNSSQIFICLSRAATAPLDNKYTSFGQTVRGAETIQAIAAVPVGPGDRPTGEPPRIISARLVDAPPYGDGPQPVAAPGAGAIDR